MTQEEIKAASIQLLDEITVSPVSLLPFEGLALGWHEVTVKIAMVTNDFMKGLRNPTMKDSSELPVWTDPTKQIAVYFENEHRQGIVRRFALYGFWKYADLLAADAEYAKACFEAGEQKYAVDSADKVRLIHKENTEKARFILQRFLNAVGFAEGTKLSEALPEMVGKKLLIEVTGHKFNGKDYTDVSNYAVAGTPAEDLKRIPKPAGVVSELPVTQA